MDLQQYRQANLETWQAMSAAWESRHDQIAEVAGDVSAWMVDKLDPQPGQTILELAAGLGETGFLAAQRMDGQGRLITTDLAPLMIDAATRRAAELALGNVVCRVMDAEEMDLPDDCVDGVLCRWGYMVMADPGAALAETRRVLRDGGACVFSVWGEADSNPWAGIPARVMMQKGLAPRPEPGAPGIFNMADEERIRFLLSDAGFGVPEIEEMRVSWRFSDFEDYWSFVTETAGSLAMLISALDEDHVAEVRAETEEAAQEYADDGGLALPGLCLNAVAR